MDFIVKTHSGDDVVGWHGDVLDAGTAVIINVLLDLTLGTLHWWGGLADRHLDGLLVVCDDHRAQGRELCVHLGVVHRTETMKLQGLLIPRISKKQQLVEKKEFCNVNVFFTKHKCKKNFWPKKGNSFILEEDSIPARARLFFILINTFLFSAVKET